jgi:hypothetical protein
MLKIAGQRGKAPPHRAARDVEVARRLASEGAFLVATFDNRDRGSPRAAPTPHGNLYGSPTRLPPRMGTYIALQR